MLEKRKSFMQKSGTRRSLCRLRPRLLHIVLDVFLIVCLVVLLYHDLSQITVISQNVGQLQGRFEGLLCIASEIMGFFRAFISKPRSDRISLRGKMVNSQGAKDLEMISFGPLW
jgi:hypothetical protein